MNWPFGFGSEFFDDAELSQWERFGMVERVALHFLNKQVNRKGTKEGDAEVNEAIVRLLRGMQLIELPPPGALIDLIGVQLGVDKRSRSAPRNEVSRDRAAMFLAENPNASDRAVARGANAAVEKIEWVVKPYPKLSHHSVKKWRTEPEFQQLVSEYRRK